MSKDLFHLKKPVKDNIIYEKNINAQHNKDALCYDLDNKNGTCSYVIIEGIDIGWLWRDINLYSRKINNIINKKKNSKKDEETTTDAINKLDELENIQEDIQNYVLKSAFNFLFLITAYVTLTKYDEDLGQFFGITNICYFIKDLIHNGSFSLQSKSKYKFGYIALIFVGAFLIFLPEIVHRKLNPPGKDEPTINKSLGLTQENSLPFGMLLILMFIIILSLGWIVLGNVLFTKRSVLLIAIIFVSAILIGMIVKSAIHYNLIETRKRGIDTLPESETNKLKWVSIILIGAIIIINICIITYIAIKNIKFIENTEASVKNIDPTFKNLTEYFKKHIFEDLQKDQETLINTIGHLKKNYKTLINNDAVLKQDMDLKNTYVTYFKKLLHAIKSKDEWFKNTCKLYRLDPDSITLELPSIEFISEASKEGSVETEVFVKLFEDDDEIIKTFFTDFGRFIPEKDSHLAKDWVVPAVIRDLILGGILRIVELFNIFIRNPIDIFINCFKTILHFTVHSLDKKNNIKDLSQMNLLNYWHASILKTGTVCNIDYAHKRIAAMYDLFIQLNMPSSN